MLGVPISKSALLGAAIAVFLPGISIGQDIATMYSNSVFQQGVIASGSTTLDATGLSPTQSEQMSTDQSLADQPSPQPVITLEQALQGAVISAFSSNVGFSTQAVGALSYQRDPQVSVELADQIEQSLTPENAAAAQHALDNLASGGALSGVDAMLQQRGMSVSDLGDVFTTWLLFKWEIVNGIDPESLPGAVEAVRSQAQLMGDADRLGGLSDIQKQQLAEILIYEVLLVAAVVSQIIEGTNPTAPDALRQELQEYVERRVGLSLRNLDLTADGFVARG